MPEKTVLGSREVKWIFLFHPEQSSRLLLCTTGTFSEGVLKVISEVQFLSP